MASAPWGDFSLSNSDEDNGKVLRTFGRYQCDVYSGHTGRRKKTVPIFLVLPPWIHIYMKPQNFVGSGSSRSDLKGTVSRDFLLLVFFMNQFPPSPRVFHLDRFEFFRKFAEIFASQGAPPVSTTPVANFSTIFASVVDTAANLPPVSTIPAANLPPVSTIPAANLPPVSTTPVATCHR